MEECRSRRDQARFQDGTLRAMQQLSMTMGKKRKVFSPGTQQQSSVGVVSKKRGDGLQISSPKGSYMEDKSSMPAPSFHTQSTLNREEEQRRRWSVTQPMSYSESPSTSTSYLQQDKTKPPSTPKGMKHLHVNAPLLTPTTIATSTSYGEQTPLSTPGQSASLHHRYPKENSSGAMTTSVGFLSPASHLANQTPHCPSSCPPAFGRSRGSSFSPFTEHKTPMALPAFPLQMSPSCNNESKGKSNGVAYRSGMGSATLYSSTTSSATSRGTTHEKLRALSMDSPNTDRADPAKVFSPIAYKVNSDRMEDIHMNTKTTTTNNNSNTSLGSLSATTSGALPSLPLPRSPFSHEGDGIITSGLRSRTRARAEGMTCQSHSSNDIDCTHLQEGNFSASAGGTDTSFAETQMLPKVQVRNGYQQERGQIQNDPTPFGGQKRARKSGASNSQVSYGTEEEVEQGFSPSFPQSNANGFSRLEACDAFSDSSHGLNTTDDECGEDFFFLAPPTIDMAQMSSSEETDNHSSSASPSTSRACSSQTSSSPNEDSVGFLPQPRSRWSGSMSSSSRSATTTPDCLVSTDQSVVAGTPQAASSATDYVTSPPLLKIRNRKYQSGLHN